MKTRIILVACALIVVALVGYLGESIYRVNARLGEARTEVARLRESLYGSGSTSLFPGGETRNYVSEVTCTRPCRVSVTHVVEVDSMVRP